MGTCPDKPTDEQALWEFGVWDDGTFAPGFSGFGPSNAAILATQAPDGSTACEGNDSWIMKLLCMALQFDVFRLYETESETFRITDPPLLPVPEYPLSRPLYAMDGQPCEGIPIAPLLEPVRDLDIILAVDATSPWVQSIGDPNSFPEGDALQMSAFYALGRGLPFPEMPLLKDFVNEPELLQKNTFFGCFNASVPAVVYVPHRNVTYSRDDVNLFVGEAQISVLDQEEIFENGRAMVTGDNFQSCLLCISQAKFVQRRSTGEGQDREAFEATLNDLGRPCMGCLEQCWSGPSSMAGYSGDQEPQAFLDSLGVQPLANRVNVTEYFYTILGAMESFLVDPMNATFPIPEDATLS